MNDLQIEGNTKILIGKLKKKYGSIIGDDKLIVEGKIDEMIGVIKEKTGKTKEAILKEIDSLK